MFTQIFEQAGAEMPPLTKFVINVSSFFQKWWWTLPLVGGAGFAAYKTFDAFPHIHLLFARFRLALPVIGKRLPSNLIHVIINNGAHETVGGMPVCSGAMNIPALASAAGYPSVFSADSEDALKAVLKDSLPGAAGPVLIEVRCACGARADLGRPTTTPVENRNAFMRFLQK